MQKFISKFTQGYEWEPPQIPYDLTRTKLTGEAGAGNIVDLFVESSQYKKLRSCLPVRVSNYAYDSIRYALCLLTGFWLGAECLEDVERYKRDPLILAKLGGKIPTAKATADWLRDFNEPEIQKTMEFTAEQALAYRNHLSPKTAIILDMDSTSHPQSGEKIEGVAWNYKNEWALDSLSCFCNMGFCYGFELRGGSTYSSVGAPAMLNRIIEAIKKDPVQRENEIFFRADSAFCNEEMIRACLAASIKFSITAHGNLQWQQEALKIPDHEWKPWVYTKDEIEESIRRERALPRVEVAVLLFTPSWATNIRFKLVVKRTYELFEEGLFKDQGFWNYYGVLTNITDFREEPQSILEHHAQRGSAENRIKAFKGDYDLRHLPCLKMSANFAYALLGMIALNFHRALSLVEDPQCPHFAKSFRERLIRIPGKLLYRARAFKVKIEGHWMQEVNRLSQAWRAPPIIPLTFHLRLLKPSG